MISVKMIPFGPPKNMGRDLQFECSIEVHLVEHGDKLTVVRRAKTPEEAVSKAEEAVRHLKAATEIELKEWRSVRNG